MDLRSLNTFIQVAESGSFTRAGEKLGYSQPTISVQIKQLEKELGIKLFDRIGHTVRLTDKGRDALSHAQRICHMCQEMVLESNLSNEPQGIIRLAMADSVCSPLISRGFARFREHYPNISLKIMTAGTGEMFRLLDHNEVDIVCTLDNHIYNTNYVVANEEKVGVHFVVSSDSPLAKLSSLTIEDLLTQPFLLTEKGMSYRRLMDEMLARSSMEIQPFLEIGRADIICELVEKGMGVSLLPDYVTESAIRKGTIARLRVPGYEPELWKQLLYHRDKWVSPQMQAIITHLTDIRLNDASNEESASRFP